MPIYSWQSPFRVINSTTVWGVMTICPTVLEMVIPRSTKIFTMGHSLCYYWTVCAVVSCFSHVQLFVTPWTIALQAPLSMGFSRQEYWSGLPFPSPGDLPNTGTEPVSLMSLALTGMLFILVPSLLD